ncbi:MAG: site-2 protease family protein [Solirubrobacterales bacterium]
MIHIIENENDKTEVPKPKIWKILFNIIIVPLTILLLGFAINFSYAFGYLFIIIIHEAGHYFTAKFLKLNVTWGGFTPFGAYIIHENTKSCKENAVIAIGGPLLGGILGLTYFIIYFITGNHTFLALSFTSILLNLLNLIPVSPLDGGQIVEAISPIFCYLGFPFLIYLFINTERLKTRILLIIIIIAGLFKTYDFTIKYKTDSYYKLDKNSRVGFTILYCILVISLATSSLYLNNVFNYEQLIKSIARFK